MSSLTTLLKQIPAFGKPFIENTFKTNNKKTSLLQFPYHQVTIYEATESDVNDAIKGAVTSFISWSQSSGAKRRKILLQLADALERNGDVMAQLECLSVGKPISEARYDVKDAIECFRFFAGFADKIYGQTFSFHRSFDALTLRQPIGPCALVTSYNYPLVLTTWKLAPALACGNTCLIKPHENTPLSALYLAKLLQENTDIPQWVVSVLPGKSNIGKKLVESDGVRKVSFTGSPGVGSLIMQASAKTNFKKVTLELGGKSPLIVFDDIEDTDKVVQDIIGAIFANAGQNCCAGSRLFIQKKIYQEVVSKLKLRAEALIVGDPFDERTEVGPIINKLQYDKIMKFIDDADGKRSIELLTGGSAKEIGDLFVKPTIFVNVPDDDELSCEEIFGPVLSVMQPFDTEEEVVSRANSSEYGLAAGVWSSNGDRLIRMQRQIHSGTVWINCYNLVHAGLPFGGSKTSGIGHDLGWESIYQEYTQPKTVIRQVRYE